MFIYDQTKSRSFLLILLDYNNITVAVVVVKVTEISQVVTETVDHLDDSCHVTDRAGHVISLPPEVDFVGLPRPEVHGE